MTAPTMRDIRDALAKVLGRDPFLEPDDRDPWASDEAAEKAKPYGENYREAVRK